MGGLAGENWRKDLDTLRTGGRTVGPLIDFSWIIFIFICLQMLCFGANLEINTVSFQVLSHLKGSDQLIFFFFKEGLSLLW